MIDYPNKLNKVFDKLDKYSAKPVIVGGFIRDKLLGFDPKDIDIEVYGISSFTKLEEILEEFGSVNSVGKSFGVCKLKFDEYELDFSFPRIDSKIDSGHRGFEIEVNPSLDFKTATSRRDFTINAIGFDVKNKELLDPFNGINDLKNKILKAVNENTFIEDPLRVLRAAQFCARFNLEIDENLLSTCRNMVSENLLDELPKERIFEEIKKIFLKSNKPSIGFEFLKKFGTKYYTNNIYVLDEIVKNSISNSQTKIVLLLAGLCYNFNEQSTIKFIQTLTNEKELINKVLPLIKNYNKIEIDISNYELYKLATIVNIEEVLILSSAIYFTNYSKTYEVGEVVYEKAKKLNILNNKLPALLKGRDLLALGLTPSQEFSKILHVAYEAQMHEKFKTHDDATNWLKKYLFIHS